MTDLKDFIESEKSMVIAPAGYGKTHTIIDILKCYQGSKKILVLTHTHAGIASIREKAKKEHIDSALYSLDTISSFALFLTNSFVSHKERIPQPDDDNYFPCVIAIASNIIKAKPVKDYLFYSYSHLIVDEYQDCTLQQHRFVMRLSEIMKTHILGDPLQGIFDFNGDIVNFNSIRQNDGFNNSVQELDEPWRWKNKNEQLGRDLIAIRKEIIESDGLEDISNYQSIIYYKSDDINDIYNPTTDVYKQFNKFMMQNKPDSLLIIVPEKYNVSHFVKRFQAQFGIREINDFDDKWFYKKSKEIDSGINVSKCIFNLLSDLFPKTVITEWINNNTYKVKRKRNFEDNSKFYNDLSNLYSSPNYGSLRWYKDIITLFRQWYFRQCNLEKTYAIIKAVDIAISKSTNVYEGMKKGRDITRRIGRKVFGRYVGTTLLTKGLEFETVIIINPNILKNEKHLYVALTRATHNLIVISTSKHIKPNSNN